MNSLNRIVNCLFNRKNDHVPVYPIIAGAGRTLVGASYKEFATNAEVCANTFIKIHDEIGGDCIVTLIDLSLEAEAWGQEITYPENEAAVPNYQNCLIKDINDYQKIKKVDYRTSKRMMMHIEVCKKLVEIKGNDVPIVAFVFGPLGILSMLRNQALLYMDLYDDLAVVKKGVNEIAETLKEYVAALCDTGVSGIMWDTLFASGSIMSKEMWMEAEGVLMPELAQIVRDKGCLNMIHNCGENIYFDVQIKAINPIAISFLYPPDDCKDFYECKEKYGQQVTLIGCVAPIKAIIGTDEEWDAECKKQIDAMAKDGGFILATGCEYPANAPLERAKRMIKIAKTYGKYELSKKNHRNAM